MVDNNAMLAAHVRFEVEQWTGEQLSTTLTAEVSALYRWLDTVPADELPGLDDDLSPDQLLPPELGGALLGLVQRLAGSVREAVLAADPTVADLLPRESYDQFASALIGMRPVREALIAQITTSELYSRLISHVLYRGIKNYLLSESPIARRVPGVTSLMRMGQGALNSAVPNLERSIDNQLAGFVNSNVADAIGESRQFLDSVLDDDLLREVADEIWRANADATIASMVELLSDESVSQATGAGRNLLAHLRQEPLSREVMDRVVADLRESYRGRSVAQVLAEFGLTEAHVSEHLIPAVAPWFRRAAADGFLEDRIRARLEPFYAQYSPAPE